MEIRQNARNWLARAEESRTVADGMRDPESKKIMEGVVAAYELPARLADDRERGEAQRPEQKQDQGRSE